MTPVDAFWLTIAGSMIRLGGSSRCLILRKACLDSSAEASSGSGTAVFAQVSQAVTRALSTRGVAENFEQQTPINFEVDAEILNELNLPTGFGAVHAAGVQRAQRSREDDRRKVGARPLAISS